MPVANAHLTQSRDDYLYNFYIYWEAVLASIFAERIEKIIDAITSNISPFPEHDTFIGGYYAAGAAVEARRAILRIVYTTLLSRTAKSRLTAGPFIS